MEWLCAREAEIFWLAFLTLEITEALGELILLFL